MRMTTTTTHVAMAMLLMIEVAGCAAKSSSSSPASSKSKVTRLNSNTDPCAMRMHDICAPLLLYFGRYQQLPEHIDELAQVPGVEVPELVCPVSKQKYIYNPNGPTGPNPGTRIILYDATPAHAGHRWGIEVREPAPGQAFVTKVVLVPETLSSKVPR
jgi:hypothetical protein